ncbi:helix-turn-helix domain-containing protein [Paractinoplanes hotanensis]|uniref:Helix-turn-helix domain-containing protein n=1 Tax=Paractinoplanes hotanensis TaxID=2906497 RepID=A0ABT0XV45_9ACTN|nr:helix-turn-helix domain-containing protein [Actinoplanes hotanensis]MCM4077624.1 helix-turn-helix domain-containing protein [Actinoplanes hotanensis]
MGAQIHSVPAVVSEQPCEVAVRAVPGWLRPYVIGLSGFRSGSGLPVAHLVLPLASTTVIVDFGSPSGLVSGAREVATTRGDTWWGHGVSFGLTPLGVGVLFGAPMREFGGGAAGLPDLLGPAATELPGLLGAAAGWEQRFDLLEAMLRSAILRAELASTGFDAELADTGLRRATGVATPTSAGRGAAACPERHIAAIGTSLVRGSAVRPDPAVTAAWWRLRRGDRPRIGVLADELGVGRRRLERGFRQHIGMSPATVARIARFQRVVGRFGAGAAPAEAAAGSGLADQSHLARETRALAGMTPSALAAHLRTPPVLASQTSKTAGRGGPSVRA